MSGGSLYIWNYSSSSWVFIDLCSDFCTFQRNYTFSGSWSDDYYGSGIIQFLISRAYASVPRYFYSANFSYVLNSTVSYVENVSIYFNDNISNIFTVWENGSFTENDSVSFTFTDEINSMYPFGSSDVLMTMVADGSGIVSVDDFYFEYVPIYGYGSSVPPLLFGNDTFVEFLFVGGGLFSGEVLESYNPEVYHLLFPAFEKMFEVDSLEEFPSNFGEFLRLVALYIFRQPASLIVAEVEA